MDTADKLMNIAVDGDPGEAVVVDETDERETDAGEVVEETTTTRRVRRDRPASNDRVIIIED